MSYFYLYEDKLVIFYESFIHALQEQGNEVLFLNTTGYLQSPWNGGNELKETIDESSLVQKVIDFEPDLCISFNNSIPSAIVSNIHTPIVLWHGDTFMYFNGKDELKSNPDRYYYVCPFQRDIDTLKEEINPTNSKILNLLPATSIKREEKAKDDNVSFIGSLFQYHDFESKLRDITDRSNIIDANLALKNNPLLNFEDACTDANCSEIISSLSYDDLITFSSVQDRNMTLAALHDLGLKIYGKSPYFDWLSIGRFLPNVGLCVSDEDVFSLKHNQDIYNKSTVSLSVSHAQAAEGFPWRVFDVMASGSCLLSDYRGGISDFTKGYVDIPMFRDPFESRKLCKDLLSNTEWREEIILGSNACIEDKGRWHHRFRDIGEAVGVSLLNPEVGIGGSTQLFSCEFVAPCEDSPDAGNIYTRYKDNRYINKFLSFSRKLKRF